MINAAQIASQKKHKMGIKTGIDNVNIIIIIQMGKDRERTL